MRIIIFVAHFYTMEIVTLFRDTLQKYFLPNNFQEMPVTKPLEPEQKRLHTGFDVNINFVDGASIELLFTKDGVRLSMLTENLVHKTIHRLLDKRK